MERFTQYLDNVSVGQALNFAEHAFGINDHGTEVTMQQSDRLLVQGAGYLVSSEQMAVTPTKFGNLVDEKLATSVDVAATKKTQGERFFLIEQAEWDVSQMQFATLVDVDIINRLIRPIYSVSGLLNYYTYLRCGVEVIVQINPTAFQQGGLLVTLQPGSNPETVNLGSNSTMPNFPCGFLNCNINNAVQLSVPFVFTRGQWSLRAPPYELWRVHVQIWAQLLMAAGTTTHVTVSVLARLTNLELHGIRPPTTQMLVPRVQLTPGQDALNLSNKQDSVATMSLALGQEDFLDDPSISGGMKCDNFSTFLSIPSLCRQFTVSGGYSAGQVLDEWQVSPVTTQLGVTNLASVASQFLYWRGDIEYVFTAYPTKYHSGRLLLVFIPANESSLPGAIPMEAASMGFSAVWDFCGPQSTFTFRVPWVSETPYKVVNSNVALGMGLVGVMRVYIYNRLTAPANVSQGITINVCNRSHNMKFFVPLYSQPTVQSQGWGDEVEEQEKQTQPLEIGDEQEVQVEKKAVVLPKGMVGAIEEPTSKALQPGTFVEVSPGQERHKVDHMNIREFMGRAHYIGQYTFQKNGENWNLNLGAGVDQNVGVWRWFYHMFHLLRGPLDMQLSFSGNANVDLEITFIPNAVGYNDVGNVPSINSRMSLGLVRVNTGRTNSLKIRIPWYNYLTAISRFSGGGDWNYGIVRFQINNYTTADEYLTVTASLSFTDQTEVYFPRAMMPAGDYLDPGPVGFIFDSPVDPSETDDMTFEEEEQWKKKKKSNVPHTQMCHYGPWYKWRLNVLLYFTYRELAGKVANGTITNILKRYIKYFKFCAMDSELGRGGIQGETWGAMCEQFAKKLVSSEPEYNDFRVPTSDYETDSDVEESDFSGSEESVECEMPWDYIERIIDREKGKVYVQSGRGEPSYSKKIPVKGLDYFRKKAKRVITNLRQDIAKSISDSSSGEELSSTSDQEKQAKPGNIQTLELTPEIEGEKEPPTTLLIATAEKPVAEIKKPHRKRFKKPEDLSGLKCYKRVNNQLHRGVFWRDKEDQEYVVVYVKAPEEGFVASVALSSPEGWIKQNEYADLELVQLLFFWARSGGQLHYINWQCDLEMWYNHAVGPTKNLMGFNNNISDALSEFSKEQIIQAQKLLSHTPCALMIEDENRVHKKYTVRSYPEKVVVLENKQEKVLEVSTEKSVFTKLKDALKAPQDIKAKMEEIQENVMGEVEDIAETMRQFESKASTNLDKIQVDVKATATRASKLMDSVKDAIEVLKTDGSKKWAINIYNIVAQIAKICVSIYICYTTNWDSAVVASVVGLLTIDLTVGISQICSKMIDAKNDLLNVITSSLETVIPVTPSTQGAWDAVRQAGNLFHAIRGGKGLMSDVIGVFKEVLQKLAESPITTNEVVLECKEGIDEVMDAADKFLGCNITEERVEDMLDSGQDLLSALQTIRSLILGDKDFTAICTQCTQYITRVTSKLSGLDKTKQSGVIRQEPKVVYMYGPRGSGKTLASLALAAKLCKHFGVTVEEGIYVKPPMSDFWDGYKQQPVVLIDDMGQQSDDSDWQEFCQLVSSAPMRLNMAALEEKGRYFTSPVIIATSNLESPSPKTVYCQDAIRRRLGIKVEVLPKSYYMCKSEDGKMGGMLNVELAMKDGSIDTLECVHMNMWNGEVTISDLFQKIVGQVDFSKTVTQRVLKAFSQSLGVSPLQQFVEKVKVGVAKLKTLGTVDVVRKSKMQLAWKNLKSHMKVHWRKYVFLALGIVTSIGIGFAIYKATTKAKKQAAYCGVQKAPKVKVRPGETSQAVLEIVRLCNSNIVQLGRGCDESPEWCLNALGIQGHTYLCPQHFFLEMGCNDRIHVRSKDVVYSFSRENLVLRTFEGPYQDAVLVDFVGIPPCKKITDHFVTQDALPFIAGSSGTLTTQYFGVHTMVTELDLKVLEKFEYNHREAGKTRVISNGCTVRGTAYTTSGMCGGALISNVNKVQTPILGIHVAGGANYAYCAVVTKEMLHQMLLASSQQRIWKVEEAPVPIHTTSRTQFEKSPIYGVYKVEKEPSVISVRDARTELDFAANMLAKYATPLVEEVPEYKVASTFIKTKLTALMRSKAQEQGPLRMEEAVFGIDGMDRIDPNTSPGLPYILHGIRKKDLFSENEITDKFKNDVEDLIDKVVNGKDFECVFATFPKDELRPFEKIKAANTRAIDGSPVSYSTMFRMFCGRAIAWLQTHPGFLTGIGVGLDPDRDWSHMFREMESKGGTAIDLDFKNFDASVQPWMLEAAAQVLGSMSGLSVNLTNSLFKPLIFSKHQFGSLIYHIIGSMVSGSPCTSILNSIVNLTNTRWAIWQATGVMPDQQEQEIIVYGDDVLLLEVESEIPLEDLEQAFKQMGMQVTSANKSALRRVSLSEVTFLKRGFRVDETGSVHPTLDEKSIYGLLNWKRKNARFEDNIKDAAWFYYHHGRKKFDVFRRTVEQALSEAGLGFAVPTYCAMHVRFKKAIQEQTLWFVG
ncbi:polyprotein [caecilivirus A1]|uniref:Genome polyprotein n=1 Tax=caecilivirus A1 TaxID=3122336 RepID=A0A2P1GN66_9PICO|nr:polyprotein [Guangdong fish caecilians picornavirus]AVM87420.1 polyprotein [Guangdong fish caecilians picornavirus]